MVQKYSRGLPAIYYTVKTADSWSANQSALQRYLVKLLFIYVDKISEEKIWELNRYICWKSMKRKHNISRMQSKQKIFVLQKILPLKRNLDFSVKNWKFISNY